MESRINATDRLRREGRWSEASQQRDVFRAELKAKGHSRQEANDLAWQLMSNAFPPLTDDAIDWLPAYRFMAMAAFAPQVDEYIDADGESCLDAIWWLYGHCLARLLRMDARDWAGADYVVQEMLTEEVECDDEVIDAAIAEPAYFLQTIVAPRLANVLQQLLDAGASDAFCAREIAVNVALIDAISRTGIQSIRGAMTDRKEDRRKVRANVTRPSGAGA